jgi:cysteinyl-tRNA synthetase
MATGKKRLWNSSLECQPILKIYNTLSRTKEEFRPLTPPLVRFYNCGPTVYDYFHIGNARNFVLADVIRRYLKFKGYQVKFVQNVTDIDDKIIRRAASEGRPTTEIVEQFTRAYFDHLAALGVEKPNASPRATEHIPQMIAFIQRLIEKDFAYPVDGDVFYRVGRFDGYGKLSHKKIEDLREGERVEVDIRKENPMDFALWKAAKPGEPTWDSPWGPGRPGWHVECSVMAMTHLGPTVDIHSGGSDLVFPHHENEMAQSEAATGQPFVRFWIHNAFLNIAGEKMSKSLGNIVTMDQVLAAHPAMVVRYFFLSAHYRRPMDYGPESLDEARKALDRLAGGIETIEKLLALVAQEGDTEPADLTSAEIMALQGIRKRFCEYMDDDFNSPRALSVLFEAISSVNERRRQFESPRDGPHMRAYARATLAVIRDLGGVLGLDLSARSVAAALPTEPLLVLLADASVMAQTSGLTEIVESLNKRMARLGYEADATSAPPTWQRKETPPTNEFDELIDVAIEIRNEARKRKQFALGDQIRSTLGKMGIVLEDYRAGTLWRRE